VAEKRIALVIGNSAYQHVAPLRNPRNDATLIAETLRGLGFDLVGGRAQLDLDKRGVDAAVQDLGKLLEGADVGLFYYAGHGVQVRGANYLVPIGADPTKEADVDFQMLDTKSETSPALLLLPLKKLSVNRDAVFRRDIRTRARDPN
jgi:uncharacterized caspase-like protein